MSIPTTTFGSWVNIQPTGAGMGPEAYVAESLGDYANDYDIEAITAELLAALQTRLPAGLNILGNGELVGPASGPEHNALPEDVCRHVGELLAEIDLQDIAGRHDLTERAAAVITYALRGGKRQDIVDRETIPDAETAHQVLRDLDSNLSAEDIGGEFGDAYELVVVDEAGTELRTAGVIAE